MSEVLLQTEGDRSLMTPLGIIEGDILTYLERHGTTSMRRLVRELEGPASLVVMAVGALIRGGLARAVQHDLEIIVEARPEDAQAARAPDDCPEEWGG